jgi:hypothetical protein
MVMKNILLVLLVCASASVVMAQELVLQVAQQSNSASVFKTETRKINQQMSVVITGYNGTSKQIHIPDQIDGLPVMAIGEGAFRARGLESVTFPSTLVSIGDYAFYGNNLSSISIPLTVINIGVGAFDRNAAESAAAQNQTGTTAQNQTATAPQNQAGTTTTYTRTFTIEPAHSETVFRPTPPKSAPENVNIIVVPGYNPLQPSARRDGGIVTVQQSINLPPVIASSARTALEASQTGRTTGQTNLPGQSSAPFPQQVYGQSQQYGYVQTPPSSNSANRLNIIPEDTIDIFSGTRTTSGTVFKDEGLKVHATEVYEIWRHPVPR